MFKPLLKRLRIIPKDFSYRGTDYKRMIEANVARTEESADKNSNWAPGALGRLRRTQRWEGIKSHWKVWWHN